MPGKPWETDIVRNGCIDDNSNCSSGSYLECQAAVSEKEEVVVVPLKVE